MALYIILNLKKKKAFVNKVSLHMFPVVLQETMEKQLCDPQVLTPDFSKPEVRF